jgi:hypothetical protein
LGNYLAISMDGTHHYCSSKKSRAHCLVKQKRNGETDFYHQLLAALQVHPEQETVFPLQVGQSSSRTPTQRTIVSRMRPKD